MSVDRLLFRTEMNSRRRRCRRRRELHRGEYDGETGRQADGQLGEGAGGCPPARGGEEFLGCAIITAARHLSCLPGVSKLSPKLPSSHRGGTPRSGEFEKALHHCFGMTGTQNASQVLIQRTKSPSYHRSDGLANDGMHVSG